MKYRLTKINSIFFIITLLLIFFFFDSFFRDYLLGQNSRIGHDYSYFFPELLAGYYWYIENGLFKIPWYTPAFCGGAPFIADPQSIYYSLPQLFTVFIGPIKAIYLNTILFAITGFLGLYLLLKNKLNGSTTSSLLGGIIFALNGFFLNRMMIGHITYHAFMLIPLITYFCLIKSKNKFDFRIIFNATISGVLIAYLLFAGMVATIVPSIFSVIALGAIVQIKSNNAYKFITIFTLSSIIALGLSAFNLNATLNFLDNFPRTQYEFCGFPSFLSSARNIISLLFFGPGNYSEKIVNCFPLGRHEFEYSHTYIPLILLFITLFTLALKRQIKFLFKKNYYFLIFFIILLIPVLLNIYNPIWSKFLKTIPVIKTSSNLFRWISLYSPIIAVLTGLSVDKIFLNVRVKNYIGLVSILLIFTLTYFQNIDKYRNEYYNSELIQKGYDLVKKSKKATPIQEISTRSPFSDLDIRRIGKNDFFIRGVSNPKCYRAIFGYDAKIPKPDLINASIFSKNNESYNLKNPICYVFPKENTCEVGALFENDEKENLEKFVNYKPITQIVPIRQKIANFISLFTLLGIILIWLKRILLYKK